MTQKYLHLLKSHRAVRKPSKRARSLKTMRRIILAACTLAVAAAASREVHKLRAAHSACTLNRTRGPEPTKRFVVFNCA